MLNKTVRNKLIRKYRKELDEAIFERDALEAKIKTLEKIVASLEEVEEE